MKLYCATKNQGKLREFRHASGEFEIDTLPGIANILAPEETGSTFEENARLKAEYYSRFAPGLLFADDSGLAVDALNGAPGVYSARFAGEHAGDAANNALLLERMKGVTNRGAKFLCVIALAEAGRTLAVFSGSVEGEILDSPRGSNGFGYDPLFFYPPFQLTVAEIDEARKLTVSHRGLALETMFQYLRRR